ncbi:hypothetical protein BDB01DRAFT_455123 [Pilobolus umbonatus]|nr:hypothetical protein BDB01DRAFT_455123 [Pilobolus umbonatus]
MQSADSSAIRSISMGYAENDLENNTEFRHVFPTNSLLRDDTADVVDVQSFKELSLNEGPHLDLSLIKGHESEESESNIEEERLTYDSVLEDEEPQLPSATADAMETYENITENIYCGSATGKSIAEESMPCECKYQPEIDNPNDACGDDNYCINRMMFMECMVDDCPCGRYCRNRRFQLRQYARVDVIRTEKKGFGLRALTDLPTNAFIMEYIGEVIPNHEFIRRTKEYESAGLKHYYFMTLKTDEIIDATKKGCLARFINHSCNPNSVTQKWVVGKHMRIGIFTRRPIKAGSELTFDYKFERYGAVAQKCYCGESNCKGYIGGTLKSTGDNNDSSNLDESDTSANDEDEDDTGSSSDDSNTEINEAVTLTQKKMLRKIHRNRKVEPLHDPREVQSFVKRMLDSVGKSHLVLKLLLRLELTNADSTKGKEILRKFIRLHGLKMLKFWLSEWKNEKELLLKVLRVLSQLPLGNRNGLEDCKMFDIVGRFTSDEDPEVASLSQQLIEDWNKLKSVYRIPKRTSALSTVTQNGSTKAEDSEQAIENTGPEEKHYPPRFDSTREFFDPDDDLFEYLTIHADAHEITWKSEYPPRSTIPTAPRAMIDACVKNGYYGYGRPRTTVSHSLYPPHSSDGYNKASHLEKDIMEKSSYHASKMQELYSVPDSNMSTSYFDSSSHDSPATQSNMAIPKLPLNWRSAFADDGTIYYYNKLTGKTQWKYPEEKVSSIEGVNQSDLEDLVERAIQDTEKKKLESARSASPAVSVMSRDHKSPRLITPSTSRRGSREGAGLFSINGSLDENELKKEVGKVVTKYLSAKQKALWKGDKFLFKELARKITHHIVDREMQSSRKIQVVNSAVRTKIEKFIDSHGADLATKIIRKRKHQSLSTSSKEKTESPSSIISEDINRYSKDSLSLTPNNEPQIEVNQDWDYMNDLNGMSEPKKRRLSITEETIDNSIPRNIIDAIGSYIEKQESTVANTPVPELPVKMTNYRSNNSSNSVNGSTPHDGPSVSTREEPYYYHRRSRDSSPYSRDKLYSESSRYSGDYNRPNYRNSPHYNSFNSSYYHHPPSYFRSNNPRYYSSSRRASPPPYYHRHSASSSRRGSMSDDELYRRRWD